MIPKGVTHIWNSVFSECDSLENVTLPGGLINIGEQAFMNCPKLASVNIPESVTLIDKYAFANCPLLTNITLPKGISRIMPYVFSGCSGLTNIAIPENVTYIGAYAFEQCTHLTAITIPKSVTTLKDGIFSGCDKKILVIFCSKDSAAEKYAKENGINYKYTESADTDTDINSKKPQSITAHNFTKTYGAGTFKIGAKASGGGKLTYKVKKSKIASVSKNGKVKIRGCGKTDIIITAAATENYSSAKKTITLTVKPKKAAAPVVKAKKAKCVTVKWKKDAKASGYIIQYATNAKFTKNVHTLTVANKNNVSQTIKNLKAGKKYYFRVCSYAANGKQKIQGAYSKKVSITIKR